MRVLAALSLCAGACAVFSIHLFWAPVSGQYFDDSYKDRYFKPIEFEKFHRGAPNRFNTTMRMFNISQCSIDLMICLEDAPNDIICSRTRPFSNLAYVETICPMMRDRCHDFLTTFQGPWLDFHEGTCHEPRISEDIDYDGVPQYSKP